MLGKASAQFYIGNAFGCIVCSHMLSNRCDIWNQSMFQHTLAPFPRHAHFDWARLACNWFPTSTHLIQVINKLFRGFLRISICVKGSGFHRYTRHSTMQIAHSLQEERHHKQEHTNLPVICSQQRLQGNWRMSNVIVMIDLMSIFDVMHCRRVHSTWTSWSLFVRC